MDSLEKIKTEYMLYENVLEEQGLDDALGFIELELSELEGLQGNIKSSIRICKKNKLLSLLTDTLVQAFGINPSDDVEYYTKKGLIFENYLVCSEIFKRMFIDIYENIDEDNLSKMYRFNNFILRKASSNFDYYEGQVTAMECKDLAINYEPNYNLDTEECYNFFNEEFKNILSKEKQKTKM